MTAVASLSEEFMDWSSRYLVATAEEQRQLLAEGIALARERRSLLAALIRTDPQAALAAAIPMIVRQQLPAEVIDLLEERVSGRGNLSLIAVTPLPGQTVDEPLYHSVLIGRNEYRAYVYGRREAQMSLSGVSLWGIAVDHKMAVSESPLRVLEAGEKLAGRSLVEVCEVSSQQTEVAAEAPLNLTAPVAVEYDGKVQILCEPAHVAKVEARLLASEGTVIAGSNLPGTSGVVGRPSYAWTHGPKKVLIMRVDYSDLPGVPMADTFPITEDFAVDAFNQPGGVRDFYRQSSYGQSDLIIRPTVNGDSPDVTQVLRLPATAASYAVAGNSGLLHFDAQAAARAAGYDVDSYDRLGVASSSLGGIPGSKLGAGGMAGVVSKEFAIYAAYWFGFLVHEIGHCYGLQHANLWKVTDGNPVSPNGETMEYGDVMAMMGGGKHFNHWAKGILQWIPDATVTQVTTRGTYRVYRYDHADANLANPRAIKIVRDDIRDYWIGYARDSGKASLNNGAYVMWGYNTNRQGDLLDLNTPGTNPDDAGLAIGTTFNDTEAGITIKAVAQGGTGAEEWLEVEIGLPATVQWKQEASIVDEPSGGAILTLQRTNSSSGVVSVNYNTVSGSAIAPADFTAQSGTVSWADGDMSDKTITIPLVVDSLAENSESFTVALSGVSGGKLGATTTVIVSIGDPAAPYAITTLAGAVGSTGSANGTGSAARFKNPGGVAVDNAGNLYVADTDNHIIRKITPGGAVSTLAGSAGVAGSLDGAGAAARFSSPTGIAVDSEGTLYVADTGNYTIRKITAAGVVSTLAGSAGNSGIADGIGAAAVFGLPVSVAVDSAKNVYVVDRSNVLIRKVTPSGLVTNVLGSLRNNGSIDGPSVSARLNYPIGVAVDTLGNIYVLEQEGSTVRKKAANGIVTTLVGTAESYGSKDGVGGVGRFNFPTGIAVDSAGTLYVADSGNHTIRKMYSTAGAVATIAGAVGLSGSADGSGNVARFSNPGSVAVDGAGNIYIVDRDNQTIRKGVPPVTSPAAIAPTITLQPVFQTVVAGNAVTFTVAASGTPTPTFQWQKNNVAINGATGSSYLIASAAAGDAGSYRVVATNSINTATSNMATLTVIVAPSNAVITIITE